MDQRRRRGERAWVGVLVRIAIVVAVGVLLAQHWDTLRAGVAAMGDADVAGVLATGALIATTYVFAGVSLIAASGRPLSLGRTALTQLSAVCANRVTPAGLGAMGVNVRYLEEDGATRAEALAAIGLSGVVTFFVRMTMAIVVVVLVGHAGIGTVVHVSPAPILFAVAAVAAVVVVGAFVVRRRRDLCDAGRGAWSSVSGVRRCPTRTVGLLIGSVGTTVGHALSFVTAAEACGVRLSTSSLLIVYVGGSAVSAAAPSAAGLGSVEAALVAGLTGFGADPAAAMAAALTYRLVTYWMPIGPSLLALWWTRSTRPVATVEVEPEPQVDVVPVATLAPLPALVPVG